MNYSISKVLSFVSNITLKKRKGLPKKFNFLSIINSNFNPRLRNLTCIIAFIVYIFYSSAIDFCLVFFATDRWSGVVGKI